MSQTEIEKCPTCGALVDLIKTARYDRLIFECGRCVETGDRCRGRDKEGSSLELISKHPT